MLPETDGEEVLNVPEIDVGDIELSQRKPSLKDLADKLALGLSDGTLGQLRIMGRICAGGLFEA